MSRTEIELTEEESRRLDEVAASKGQSVAEIVRESVREYLEEEHRQILRRALAPESSGPSFKELLSQMPDTGDDRDLERNDDLGRIIDL
jgi:hypothetical protein